jgi:hypothetical protein
VRTMAGAVCLLLAALGSAAQEPIDGWLPGKTLFCLSFEDPPRTARRLTTGRYGALRGDPSAQRVEVELKDLLARAREASLERGEVWLGSFWKLARGPLLLAVIHAHGQAAPLVVLDTGEEDAFGRHLGRLADAGVLGPEVSRVYRGSLVRSRRGGEGAGAVFWTERRGVVGFSWREDAIEELIDHLDGGEPTLAPRLGALRRKLRADADALLLLPREALRELEQRNPDLLALALPDDASLGMTITLDPDAIDVRAFLFAGSRKGVLSLFDEPNTDLAPPPFANAGTFVAARFDLPRVLAFAGVKGDTFPPLARKLARALGDRFALLPGRDQVFLASVRDEAWMKRLLAAFPGTGDGVHEGPDGAIAMRDGWIVAASRPDAVRRMLAEPPRDLALSDALPRDRILLWRLAPGPPRDWDDPMRLFGPQEGALVNDADGLLLVHRVPLR